ncbi:protein kinase [candidate division KSB1 bacterium]|nr:protein kinase [candidate division KSB1 bacterium]
MVGKTISHYKILEKLGGGGMGIVYKAEDTKLKRLVALKFLPPDLTRDEEAKERFVHEAQAASALDHTNICTIYEIDETEDGQIFIAMAYYEGETLKKRVSSNQLSVDSVIEIAIQIAQGLARAHEAGITHRDIKPANIMITTRGEVKIVDFGLAKLAGQTRLTKSGMTLGTVAYMSPEQARAEEVDHRTDIWALGVVLYEMITGQLPFKGEYEQAMVYSILCEEPKPITNLRPEVPAALTQIVRRTLSKIAEDRFQTMADLLSELKQVASSKALAGGNQEAKQISARPSSKSGIAERRQVTVMSCQLVAPSMSSEPLDPEDLHALLPEYQALCDNVIARYEGRIIQSLGDGLLVSFGYPKAHEDDPRRAVLAGLGILEGLRRMSSHLEPEKGIKLAARVGIHTGLVVAGDPQAMVGETPRLATQLQNLAAPDALVVSQVTYRLIEGYFDCRELGQHAMKGISQPIPLYQVLYASVARSRLEAAAITGLTPLVGRAKEIGMLQERWEQVLEGNGQVVLLNGEAGIGKSRLVQELKAHVAANPQAWLTECYCSPYHQSSALYPLIELLERVVLQFEAEEAASMKLRKIEGFLVQYGLALPETTPLFATLLSVPLSENYSPLNLSPQQKKQKTLEALLSVLLTRASQQPLLFVLEDVHWVDPSTLELLNLIIAQAPTTKLCVLLTFRPDFTPPWEMRSYLNYITLNRLPRKEIEKMVGRVTKGKALPEEVLNHIASKTDGVPLFVEEMTKTVLESGMLQEKDDQYELVGLPFSGSLTQLTIPTTLRDSLMARLDHLATAKEVAQLAAVLGREFPYEWLHAVSPLNEATLNEELARLVNAELLYRRGVSPKVSYIFKHALIQEAAYESLLKSTRQQYHRQIAEVLAKQFPKTVETSPELLAHHYESAGLIEQALPCLQRAGEQALQSSANSEAVAHFAHALELLQFLPDTTKRTEQEMNLQIGLGEAQKNAGKTSQAMATFQRAAGIASALGSPKGLAHAALGYEEARWRFNLPAELAVGLLEDALGALAAEDSVLRVRVLAGLGRALISSSPERSAALLQQALGMARRVNDPSALLDTLNVSLYIQGAPEKTEERLAAATEMLRLAQEVGNREKTALAHYYRMYILLALGDIHALDAEIVAHGRLTEKLQQPVYIHGTMISQVMRAMLEGRFEQGERLAQEAFSYGQRWQVDNVEGIFGMQMFTIRREQGRLQELAPVVKSFVERYSAASTWRPGLALIYSELGLEQEARTEFEHLAANDFADLPQDVIWMTYIAYLSEVCAFLGDSVRAAILYQLLLPYAGYNLHNSAIVFYGAASRYLGLLAATMSRWHEAEQHFEDALEMNARMGARPWLAHTQHEYAEMLLARGKEEDRSKALSLLDEALAISQELGMKSLVEKAQKVKKKIKTT